MPQTRTFISAFARHCALALYHDHCIRAKVNAGELKISEGDRDANAALAMAPSDMSLPDPLLPIRLFTAAYQQFPADDAAKFLNNPLLDAMVFFSGYYNAMKGVLCLRVCCA